jgi:hypothetical protein
MFGYNRRQMEVPRPLYTWKLPGTHWIEVWVEPTDGLEVSAAGKHLLPHLGLRPQTVLPEPTALYRLQNVELLRLKIERYQTLIKHLFLFTNNSHLHSSGTKFGMKTSFYLRFAFVRDCTQRLLVVFVYVSWQQSVPSSRQEDGADRSPRNVSTELPLYAA